MQQRAGNRKALALAARQIGRIGLDGEIKTGFLRAYEIRDACAFERVPQGIVAGMGVGHEQVLAHRAREQVAARAYERDGMRQRLGR